MRLLDRLRRDRPPPEAVSELDPDDRLLSWAIAPDGVVVASRRGVRLPDRRFVPWHRIDKAVWRDGVLTLTEAVEVEPGVMEAGTPQRVSLTEPRDLPVVVRTRVTRTVVSTTLHPLPAGGAIRVVARRVPGRDGLEWSLRYEAGADRTDPHVRAAGERLLADATAAISPDI